MVDQSGNRIGGPIQHLWMEAMQVILQRSSNSKPLFCGDRFCFPISWCLLRGDCLLERFSKGLDGFCDYEGDVEGLSFIT
ncbi:MAG: hypothetical protein BWY63_01313 [Chloroflexi bacterium ADurb.Bin360]|nr:MAG: hypothetical protein BWY63_01313 [Chloroflexi bacterium ADurb.Bin360]